MTTLLTNHQLPGSLPGVPQWQPHTATRRRPNRAHLVHRYIRHKRGLCCSFTLDELLLTIFAGRKVHHQQRHRIRRTIDQYVRAGLLEADHTDDGCIHYLPAYGPPNDEQQSALRQHLHGLLPEEILHDTHSVMAVIDLVLDELC